MKITINNNKVNLTRADLESLVPKFSFFRGRHFDYKPQNGSGFRNVALNDLILAVKQAADEAGNSQNDLPDFVQAFKNLDSKGYNPEGQIYKESFLTRTITKIKHFFSQIKRKKLLEEIDQNTLVIKRVDDDNPPHNPMVKLQGKLQAREPAVAAQKKPDLNKQPDSKDGLDLQRKLSEPVVAAQKNRDLNKQPDLEDALYLRDKLKDLALDQDRLEGLPPEIQLMILNKLDGRSLLGLYKTSKKIERGNR